MEWREANIREERTVCWALRHVSFIPDSCVREQCLPQRQRTELTTPHRFICVYRFLCVHPPVFLMFHVCPFICFFVFIYFKSA